LKIKNLNLIKASKFFYLILKLKKF
jgi:hypothetical protein